MSFVKMAVAFDKIPVDFFLWAGFCRTIGGGSVYFMKKLTFLP